MGKIIKFFIIYGNSGSGKSTILRSICRNKNYVIDSKDTNRPIRKNESQKNNPELTFVDNLMALNYELIYKRCGYSYGIRKDLLKKSLRDDKIHFIIINDVKSIKDFKKKYPKSVAIYIHCDPKTIFERIKQRKDSKSDTKKRILIQKQQYLDFFNNNLIFDNVVINLWDINNAKKQLLRIINQYI